MASAAMRWHRMRFDGIGCDATALRCDNVGCDAMASAAMRSHRMRCDGIGCDAMASAAMRWHHMRYDGIGCDVMASDAMRCHQIQCDGIGCDAMALAAMRWHRLRCDGIGCDTMASDAMRWLRMRWLRQGLEKVARQNVGGVGRRAAKCVDLHAHDHEERREEGPFVAGHRAPRRAISPRPRTGHPPVHRGMGSAVEQAKGKGGGGGGGAAPPLGVHAGAGWAELHLVLTACDIGRHSTYDVGRLSVQPRAQRAPHGKVLISPQTHPRPRMEPASGRGSAQQVDV